MSSCCIAVQPRLTMPVCANLKHQIRPPAMSRSRTSASSTWSRRRSACTATKSSLSTTESPITARATSVSWSSAAPTPVTSIRLLLNSHVEFPFRISFGSRVFVYDKLAFVADQSIKRKHTANLKRDLPGIIGEMIEPLTLHREAQHRTVERYRQTMLTDQQADHAILNIFRADIINLQRIGAVLDYGRSRPSTSSVIAGRPAALQCRDFRPRRRRWTIRPRPRSSTRSSTACAIVSPDWRRNRQQLSATPAAHPAFA